MTDVQSFSQARPRNHLHLPTNMGDHVADKVAAGMGSWKFIIIQTIIVVFWITLNSLAFFAWRWDLPPFILLNLIFSTQASYAAPIIMMSQNRQAAIDRRRDDHEADEVEQLFQVNQQLFQINQQQLEILQQQREILDVLFKRGLLPPSQEVPVA